MHVNGPDLNDISYFGYQQIMLCYQSLKQTSAARYEISQRCFENSRIMKLIDIMVLTKERNKEGWIYRELACKTSKDSSWDKKLQTNTEDYSNCLNIEKIT